MKTRHWLASMAFLVAIGSAANVYAVLHGIVPSEATGMLWGATFSYLVALAVEAERRTRKLSAPYEHGALVFFAWPIVLPYYLYTMHKWRGLALALGIVLFSFVPNIASMVAYLLLVQD